MAATDTLSRMQFDDAGSNDEDDQAAKAVASSVDTISDPTASIRRGGSGQAQLTIAERQRRTSPLVQPDDKVDSAGYENALLNAAVNGQDKFGRAVNKVKRNGR